MRPVWPDLGERFTEGERTARLVLAQETRAGELTEIDLVANDQRDLSWAMVMKRTFESYVRGEIPNMYGEWLRW